MQVGDVAEALVVEALTRAHFTITAWDEPVRGFFLEPDIVARKDGRELVVLVNASDSFFASQKKIWRNIEEPFEVATALGPEARCASVAFISPDAENAFFHIASQFFDASFLLTKRTTSWERILQLLNREEYWPGSTKKQLAASLADGFGNALVKSVLGRLSSFFATEIPVCSALNELWSLERVRVEEVRRNRPTISYSAGHYERKGSLRASLLGIDVLEEWFAAGLDRGSTAVFDFRDMEPRKASEIRIGTDALKIHGFAEVLPALGGRIRVRSVQNEILQALRKGGPQVLQESLRAMVESHAVLADYVRGARDLPSALQMASLFTTIRSQGKAAISESLEACSKDPNFQTLPNQRNWILDILLITSGLSQTLVQRNCSISRLTSVATGQRTLNSIQAKEICTFCYPHLPVTIDTEKLAAQLLRDRLYSLETHSYANPLNAMIRRQLDRIVEDAGEPDRFEILGFPSKNSCVVPSWHTSRGSTAGQIKTQFLFRDLISEREVILRVGSCHEGHAADKRKEVSAKGRILSYSRINGHFRRNDNRLLVLVLDGDWEGPEEDRTRNIRMMNEAGWQVVLGTENVADLPGACTMHLQHREQRRD